MKTRYLLLIPLCAVPLATATASDYPPPGEQIYVPSSLRGSIGLRHWYSRSKSDIDHNSTSVLSADGRTGHSAEVTFTLEDVTEGTFFRAYAGLGRNIGGDVTYLNASDLNADDTNFGYLTVDGGWKFTSFANGQANLKGFVGYQYISDETAFQSGSANLSSDAAWHALRLGMTVDGNINQRVGWSFNLAGVPWSYNKVGSIESKYTYGVEADAMVDFAINPNWQLGVGGRYWWLKSDYEEQTLDFEGTYSRYGLLAQTSYRF